VWSAATTCGGCAAQRGDEGARVGQLSRVCPWRAPAVGEVEQESQKAVSSSRRSPLTSSTASVSSRSATTSRSAEDGRLSTGVPRMASAGRSAHWEREASQVVGNEKLLNGMVEVMRHQEKNIDENDVLRGR